jgi:hypothetical protein
VRKFRVASRDGTCRHTREETRNLRRTIALCPPNTDLQRAVLLSERSPGVETRTLIMEEAVVGSGEVPGGVALEVKRAEGVALRPVADGEQPPFRAHYLFSPG